MDACERALAQLTTTNSVCIISIILIVECVRLDPKSPDITWNFAPIILWAGVEQNLAIVSGTLPLSRLNGQARIQNRSSRINLTVPLYSLPSIPPSDLSPGCEQAEDRPDGPDQAKRLWAVGLSEQVLWPDCQPVKGARF